MAGIMPAGGIGPANAANSLPNADLKNGCDSLWHANRCQPRFDPASQNAVISEILNAVNGAGLEYDCGALDNLAKAMMVHEISGNTSFRFNNTGAPVPIPNGSNKKIGGGSFTIPNTFHRAINVLLYLDCVVQWNQQGGDDTSNIELAWKINDINNFDGVQPNLIYALTQSDKSQLLSPVWTRVVPVPPGGRTYFWEVRSTQGGPGDWVLQYTDTALQLRCYGVSTHSRDNFSTASPPDE